MPHIHPLNLNDLPELLAIQSVCYGDGFHESAQAFRAKLEASPNTHWLCRRNGQALGYLVALPVAAGQLPSLNAPQVTKAEAAEWLYLHDMAILSEARSLGLGKRFIGEAERVARETGLRGLALVAVQGAEGYWARAGFVLKEDVDEEVRLKLASFGGGAVYMEKELV